MDPSPGEPLLRKIDCVRLYVPDLDAGLAFYRDQLGHSLLWRTADAVGLAIPDADAELVLQTEDHAQETDFLVDSAERAAERITEAGGSVLRPPFDIRIGRCVVVRDPWGNTLVLLDASKGLLATDADGNVIGNRSP
jgi:predicted enzyme related to lactoylglutathione lyase